MIKLVYTPKIFFLAILVLWLGQQGFAFTRTASVTGNWSNTATWGGNPVPAASDAVIINSNVTVTLDVNTNNILSLTINTQAATGTNGLVVGTYTLNTGTIVMTGSGTSGRFSTISISTGTVNATGNISFSGTAAQARLIFSGAGTLNVGGSFAIGIFTASTGTVNFNANAAQSIGSYTYNNLTLSGTLAKTTTGATVNGILSLEGTATTTGTAATYGSSATLQYKGTGAQTTGTEFPATWSGSGGVVIANTSGNAVTLNQNKTVNKALTVKAGAILALSNRTLGSPTSLTLEGGATTGASITGSGILTLGGDVTINDATTGTSGATISAPLALGATRTFTVNDDGTSATDLTISGIISGAFGVTKAGAGTMMLSGANTYTGTTSISEGTLSASTIVVAAGASNIGNTTSAVVLGSSTTSGTLLYTGASATYTRGFTVNAFGGGINNTTANLLTIGTGGIANGGQLTLTNTSTGGTTISSIISSTGSITVNNSGTGTTTLSGTNTYTGNTSVSAGTLKLGSTTALGTSAATTVSLGAVLDLSGFTLSTARPLTLNGTGLTASPAGALTNTGGNATYSGAITLGSASTITATTSGTLAASGSIGTGDFALTLDGVSGSNGTISGVVSSAIIKNGTGTWTLSGINTYTGATTINAGTLKAGVATQAFGVTSAVTLANTSGATLDITGYSNTIGSLTGGGITGGSITLGAATLTIGSDNSSPAAYAGEISGSGALTKSGTGTLILSGTNIYTGATTVSTGVLNIQNAAALGTTAAGTTVSNLAALQIQGGITVTEAITLQSPGISSDGGIRNISGDNTLSGAITLSGSSKIASDAGLLSLNVASGNSITGTYNLTFSGGGNITVADLIDISSATLTKDGTGTLTFSVTNTYGGTTTINEGILSFAAFGSNGFAGSNGNGTLVLGGGTLQYTGSTASTVQNITLTTGTASSIDVASGTTLTMSGANPVSNGSLIKLGAGTLVLSGTSSFTGGTTITAGTLALGGSDKLDNSGSIILSGGTLSSGAAGFTETIGILDLAANSIIALGTGVHTLTFANSSAEAWTSNTTLTITGWAGAYNGASSGTAGKIFIGSSVSGLSAIQLAQIQFFDGTSNNPAIILSSGEVVASRDAPSNLSYTTPNTFIKNIAITNLNPTVTGFVSSYSVSPALPAGLSLNTTTGVISGTPTIATATADYTVTASNSVGSTTFDISITVVNTILTFYSRASGNWTANTTWSFTSGGGAVGAGIYPQAGDNVIVERIFTVTVNISNAECATLQLGSPGNSRNGVLTFSGTTPSLTVSGIVQLGGYGNTNRTGTITFTSGSTLHAGSVAIGNTLPTPAAGTITMTNGGILKTGSFLVNTVTGNTWTPGTGTVILDANNTLPSTIVTSFKNLTISAGTTTMAVAIPTLSGTLTVNAGATLALSTFPLGATTSPTSVVMENGSTGSTISGTGAGILHLGGPINVNYTSGSGTAATISCPINLDATRIFTIADEGTASDDFTISNVISTAFGITKAGSGTMTLSGTNTFTGGVLLDNGTLNINNSQALGTIAGTFTIGSTGNAVTLNNTSGSAIPTLDYPIAWNGDFTFTGTNDLNLGTGTVTLNASRQASVSSGTLTLGGTVSGSSYGLTKAGAGELSLDANMATLHDLTISNGTFTSTSGILNLSGTIENSGTFNHNNGTVNLNGSSAQTISGLTYYNIAASNAAGVSLAGNTTLNGTLTLTIGTLSVGSNTLTFQNSDTPILKLLGTITTTENSNLVFGTSGNTVGSAFTIPNSTFTSSPSLNNLTINRTNSLTWNEQMLSMKGVLLCSNGTFNTNGNLTLLSTATQTALIDGAGSGSVDGNVSMQRYIASGFGYKYISSPFQGATVNELSDDLDLTATFATVFAYDEDNHSDSSGVARYSTGWTKYITSSGLLTPMKGFAANLGAASETKTIDITGVVNNDLSSPLTLYNHNRQYTKGFNLVGNPYPSPIDWNASSGWTKTNIDNAVYYFDAGVSSQYTGTYSSYANGVSSNGTAGNIIPAMQGFFVHVTNGSYPVTASLGMGNQVRVNNLSSVFHKSADAEVKPLVRLTAEYDTEKIKDAAVVYFDELATTIFDKEFDALKLMNTDQGVPNLYSVTTETDRLSISAIPYPADSSTRIPLGLKTEKADWVTLNVTNIENIPSGLHIYLEDALTGLVQDMQINPEYRVHIEKGILDSRFTLIFSDKDLVHAPTGTDTFFATVVNGRLSVTLDANSGNQSQLLISNMPGQVMHRENLYGSGAHEINTQLPAGIYVLTIYGQKGICSQKIYIPN